jgi:hypothetical protein
MLAKILVIFLCLTASQANTVGKVVDNIKKTVVNKIAI